jgi:GTP-binding protein HflX
LARALLVVRGDDLDEALELARVVHSNVDTIRLPNRYRPSTSTYLTPKWVELVKEKLENGTYDKVYIYDILSPRHVSHLMKELGVVVEDRVMLILDVLAEHAGSKEAKIQIEMARLRHQLPLIRDWINRSKLGELPGFLGPGGYAVDAYYTHVRRRISKLRKELEKIRRVKDSERIKREEKGLIHVAIVGYTNAGKTTLFNSLTGEKRATGPELLTTTSTKAKMIPINGLMVVLIDTVGFIKDIPPEIVEAFYATLKEISASSAVILLLDSSDEEELFTMKLRESLKTLTKIGYVGRPLLIALNKVDLVSADQVLKYRNKILAEVNENAWRCEVVEISALMKTNLELLKNALIELIENQLLPAPKGEGPLRQPATP